MKAMCLVVGGDVEDVEGRRAVYGDRIEVEGS